MRKKLIFLAIFLLSFPLMGGIKVEFYGKGGIWSLNLLKSQIEKFARDRVDEVVREKLEEDYPELQGVEYQHSETFSSSGSNLALGLRIYPGGRNSAFSIGVFFVNVKMDVSLEGQIHAEKGSDYADMNGKGEVNLDTYGGLVELRWEIFPSSVITPYFSLGAGMGNFKGEVSYEGQGKAYVGGSWEDVSQSEKKTVDELRSEEPDIPSSIPFIQLSFGLRGKILNSLSLFAEGGILNGFYLSGGIAFSF